MSKQKNKIDKKVTIKLEELLKIDAPYIVEDGKVNVEKLKGLLTGKTTEKEDDRFYFNWAGKDKVFQAIQAPAYSTLSPQKDKSIGWDETENLMIVGENLETLKLLLKPYFGKVKVIYIDPPYNTGKDFIYKDDFSSPLKDYLEKSGQKDGEGMRLTTNAETGGRYHSDWLNFMYPRLFVGRDLLMDEGVIFVSIDDNEFHHLRMVMDEIFGEENFIGTITWEKRTKAQNTETAKEQFQSKTEYIVVYKKFVEKIKFNLETTGVKTYDKEDDKGKYRLKVVEEMSAIGMRGRHTMIFPIRGIKPKSGNQWKVGKETVDFFENRGDIEVLDGKAYFRLRPEDENNNRYSPFWSHFFDKDTYGTAETGKSELSDLLGTNNHEFETVKPTKLIKKLLFHTTKKDEKDLILDFFAGSGTTGQAVCELNKEDEGNRKFLLVQIDEETKIDSQAYKSGFHTITDICLKRLEKASERNSGLLKYKIFNLSPSNFNLKEEFELEENKDLKEVKNNYLKELGLYVDQPTIATANALDIVYEIIIKNGFSLNSKIEELKLSSNSYYKVNDAENEKEIYISLDSKIKDVSVEAIRTSEYKGKTFAFYDNALTDSQKINLNTFVKLQVI